jgi:hypothetical protein
MEGWNWWHNGCQLNSNDNMHITFLKTVFEFWFHVKISTPTYIPFCKSYSYISMCGDFTFKVIVVKATLFNKSQCKYM